MSLPLNLQQMEYSKVYQKKLSNILLCLSLKKQNYFITRIPRIIEKTLRQETFTA